MGKMKKYRYFHLLRWIDLIWYRSKWLWLFFFPFECLYRIVVLLRRKFIKPCPSFRAPVIVVGNITVGGTGKSPLVAALAAYLVGQGYQPGIVSRGYKGKRTASESSIEVTAASDPAEVGDEPVMLARVTQCPVVVSTRRVRAVHHLLKQHPQCDVVISDDGLQHYYLHRDVSICVVDKDRHFGNRHCLPAGPLREPLSVLASFDFAVEQDKDFTVQADGFVSLADASEQPNDFFSGKTVHAVAGIGYPERFFKKLENMGLIVIRHVFPDHHIFSKQDISFNDELPVVMTEKDAVKCNTFLLEKNKWYLRIKAELSIPLQQKLIKEILSFAKK